MKKLIVLLLAFVLVLTLAACGNGGLLGGSNQTEFTLGETFEFDNLEITLSENIGFARVTDRWSDLQGAEVFYIPTTVLNVGNSSHGLEQWVLTIFSPDGRSIEPVTWDAPSFDETNILRQGNVLPDVEKSGNLYIPHAGDGEYTIEFSDFMMETPVTVRFELEFDFDAIPVVQTEFSLGDTIDIDGLELQFGQTISWGRFSDSWSDNYGELYFYLTVTMTNNSDSATGFPWSVQSFDPNGHQLDRVSTFQIDNDDITRAGDILPGTSMDGYWHLTFAGDGDYVVEFDDFSATGETLRLIFSVDSSNAPTAPTGGATTGAGGDDASENPEIGGIWQQDGDDFILYTFNPIGGFLRTGAEGIDGGYWTLEDGLLQIDLISGTTEEWNVLLADDTLTLTNADDGTVLTFTRSTLVG